MPSKNVAQSTLDAYRAAHARGLTIPEAASELGCASNTIRKWWKRWSLVAPRAVGALKAARYVYFFVDAEADRVKIGCSKNPVRRLRDDARSMNPFLGLLGFIEGGAELEGALHDRFAESHLRGEFFRYSTIRAQLRTLLTSTSDATPELEAARRARKNAAPHRQARNAQSRARAVRRAADRLVDGAIREARAKERAARLDACARAAANVVASPSRLPQIAEAVGYTAADLGQLAKALTACGWARTGAGRWLPPSLASTARTSRRRTEEERALIVALRRGGLSTKGIAERLGVSYGRVYSYGV